MPAIDSETKSTGGNGTAFNLIPGLLLAAVIANHFLWVWHYAISVPAGDDYVLILNRLIIFHNLPPGQKLGFFFDLFDVHRLVFLNVVIVGLYKIIGNIDFHTLIFIGNSSLLILLWGIWKYAGSILPVAANRIGYFLPVALLVFSPAYFEPSLWATGVLQSLPVLVFSFFAVACAAQRSDLASLAALLAALLASGTSANGMAVFLACAAVLALQQRYMRASLMALLFIAIAWAYTRGYPVAPSNHVDSMTASLAGMMHFYLTLCGSIVWGKNGATLLGVLLVAGFGMLTWQGLPRRNPVLWGFGLFLLLSMAMMSLGRTGLGLDAALLSRYKPYSGLMLVVIYLGLLVLVPSIIWKKIIGFSGLLISCATFISYLIHFDEVITDYGFHSKLRMAYRGIEGKVQVVSGFPGTDFANIVIDTSEHYGAYRPPLFSDLVVKAVSATGGASPSTQKQQNQTETDIQMYEFIDGEKATLVYGVISGECSPERFRIVLKNGGETLYFAAQPPDWGWLNIYPVRPMHGYFGGIVDKRYLPAGLYQLGLTCGYKEPDFFGGNYRVSKIP